MLRVFHRFREMDFEKLMAVYQEGNLENAQAFFPNDLPEVQLNKAQDAFAEYLREDFFRVKGAFYAVWEAENRYISALRMEPFEDGLQTVPCAWNRLKMVCFWKPWKPCRDIAEKDMLQR